MAHTSEPDKVSPEQEFQEAVKAEINGILDEKKVDGSLVEYFILEGFGLDLAVFIKWADERYSVSFFELKSFVGSRQSGVGFGNGRGEGSQVDLLLLENGRLNLANQFTRWVLVDGTRYKGTARFTVFDNGQARKSAMGGVRKGKQNNLRVNELMENGMTWDSLSKELERFLTIS